MNILDRWGNTPMDDAKRVGGNEILNALRERGGKTAKELKVTSHPQLLASHPK